MGKHAYPVVNGTRRCTVCLEVKPVSEYHRRYKSDSGCNSMCKACKKARNPRFPGDHRKALLRSKYGMTVRQYDEMRKSQDYRCAICGVHEDDLKKSAAKKDRCLHVDHCHATNKVRALLCAGCNSGIARFFDNAGLILRAFFYVQEWYEKERIQHGRAA